MILLLPQVATRRRILLLLALATLAEAADNYDDDLYAYDDQYAANDDGGGSSSSSSGGYQAAHSGMALKVCEDSVVAVTYMSVLCDSPYTFYYGNGANRKSYVCDYGDKATLDVELQVVDDLQEEDGEIFFTMAAFDDANNLLMSTYPEQLCQNYLGGFDCTKAGTYNFQKKIKFGTPYGNANQTKFYPEIHMAFSTKSDSGYNLGAVNIECQQWNQDQPSYVAWSDESPRTPAEEFVIAYGLLIVTSMMLFAMGSFIYYRSYDNPVFNGDFLPNDDDDETESSFMEL